MSIPYKTGVPLKEWTTLKIGGPADRFYQPENHQQLAEILLQARKEDADITVLGNGSNMLFEDEGYHGWIVQIGAPFSYVKKLSDTRVRVGAGMTNEALALWLADNGLSGFEFASGIPGTLGGAVLMNAGAYGGEICDVIVSAGYMDENGQIRVASAQDLDLSYRHSALMDKFGIVLWADFEFKPADSNDVYASIQDLHNKRWSKQPMTDASAGSTFKRPKEGYASALIHESGLQGFSVGDAMVSTKHAGFLINAGNASCAEFLELTEKVKEKVKQDSGIDLELEVRHIPAHPGGCSFAK